MRKLRLQFPARFALRYHLYPVRLEDHGLYLLTYDPFQTSRRAQVIAREIKEPVTWAVGDPVVRFWLGLRTGYGVGRGKPSTRFLEGRDVDDATFRFEAGSQRAGRGRS